MADNKTRVAGIDVSHHQGGGIIWPQVYQSGKRFVFLKATESTSMTDPMYQHNRKAALHAGLLVGSYHFYRFNADWAEQAHHFCEVVGTLKPGELPPVLDIEDRDNVVNYPAADNTRKLFAWLDAVHNRLGRLPIVYCDPDFATNHLQDAGFGSFPLWLAGYQEHCPHVPVPWERITYWQYSEKGECVGVYGPCDLDYYMDNLQRLRALAGLPTNEHTV